MRQTKPKCLAKKRADQAAKFRIRDSSCEREAAARIGFRAFRRARVIACSPQFLVVRQTGAQTIASIRIAACRGHRFAASARGWFMVELTHDGRQKTRH